MHDRKTIQIDFIAYHDIHAQSAQSIFESLSKNNHAMKYSCQWLIGPNQKPSGAEAAVMLDHCGHQPLIKKGPNGYRYLFHINHDLGDVDTYSREKQFIKNYDIIFVPSKKHYHHAKKAIFENAILSETGWAKYDNINASKNLLEKLGLFNQMPYDTTILYAPTSTYTYDWKHLFPYFEKLKCNFVIKNHIFVNTGQSFPEGLEIKYKTGLDSNFEMEQYFLVKKISNVFICLSAS